MKRKIIFIILVIINILFFMHTLNAKAIKTNNDEYKIEEKTYDYKILIYYPITKYPTLNNNIKENILPYLKEFKSSLKYIPEQKNQYYSLIILYENYEYKNYISYVFRIEDYTGGAHPNHRMYTVVYDKEKNKVISIEDLIKYNNQILNIFSKISREKLKNNKRIVSASMFFEGTRPKKENFINFAFTKDGILLFYPYYQIAPYSEGEFNVIIPYDNINKHYNK